MRISSARLLTGTYSLVKRSGFLETSLGSRVFTAAYFLYKRFIEDSLRDLVRSHPGLLKGGNVLDVGANLGYTAGVLARATTADQLVYAFEPEVFNYRILRRIAAQPEFHGRIVTEQCAVGAEEGSVQLWLNMRHHADHRVITDQFRPNGSAVYGVTVPMVTIDGFLERNPGPVCFIKIDVQGFELPVCEGMRKTLERNPDVAILLEWGPSAMRDLGFDPDRLLKFLAGRGFRCFLIGPDGRLSPGDPAAVEETGYVDFLFTRHSLA